MCTRYLKYTLFQTISDDSEEDAPAGIDSIESQISDYDSEKSVLKFKTWVGAKLGTTILHYFIFYVFMHYQAIIIWQASLPVKWRTVIG